MELVPTFSMVFDAIVLQTLKVRHATATLMNAENTLEQISAAKTLLLASTLMDLMSRELLHNSNKLNSNFSLDALALINGKAKTVTGELSTASMSRSLKFADMVCSIFKKPRLLLHLRTRLACIERNWIMH